MARELYLVLGVRENAPKAEIRKAYQRLARRYHPDINPGDSESREVFRRVSEAFDVLSDPTKRRFYDTHGYYADGALETGGSRLDFSFQARNDQSDQPLSEVFDGLFERVVMGFEAGSGRDEVDAGAGNDIESRVSLAFRESMFGRVTEVEVSRKRPCEACAGTGMLQESGHWRCDACSGRGRLVRARGHLRFSAACPECGGSGEKTESCPGCGGGGRTTRRERVEVDLPAGAASGSRFRFPGEGHVDPRTGVPGDLFVVTNVASHPFFKRVGDNLHCEVPITVTEAALGGKVTVPTLDGEALLRIPPGIQSGQTLRLRGKGAPSLRGEGVRGDQYVEVRVIVPRVVDERSREILRELARLHPESPRKELEYRAR